MPPKPKFTRDEIVRAALDIAWTDGAEAITARTLGARLGTSPKPVFGVFSGMEQVQQEVVRAAKAQNGCLPVHRFGHKGPLFSAAGLHDAAGSVWVIPPAGVPPDRGAAR